MPPIWLFVTLMGLPTADASYDTEQLLAHGDPANRVNLVLMGDGFTLAEQDRLTATARAVVEQLFAVPPYQQYRRFFNVTLVRLVSAESGADHPDLGIKRDTALDANYGCFDVPRLLCVDEARALDIALEAVPSFHKVLVLVNDPAYGGAGGLDVSTFSMHPDMLDLALHEVGHTFAGLADEYGGSPTGACPSPDCSEPNVTGVTDRDSLKWRAWVEADTPLPTPPESEGVGLFEGGRYVDHGVFRPMAMCEMNVLYHPFCPVCAEAIIMAAYGRLSPIDAVTPAVTGPLELEVTAAQAFRVQHLQTSEESLQVAWYVDSGPDPVATGPVLEVRGEELGLGRHEITARLRDHTPRLRSVKESERVWTQVWSVQVVARGRQGERS